MLVNFIVLESVTFSPSVIRRVYSSKAEEVILVGTYSCYSGDTHDEGSLVTETVFKKNLSAKMSIEGIEFSWDK